MVALPGIGLPHRVTLERLARRNNREGDVFAAPVADVPALVQPKSKQVIDSRPGSETKGEAIMTDTHIVAQLDAYVAPGGQVSIFDGTPAARTVQVVAAAYFQHPIAPSSAQMWCV